MFYKVLNFKCIQCVLYRIMVRVSCFRFVLWAVLLIYFLLRWVWCRFAPPIPAAGSTLDVNSLINFLGNDYNAQLFVYQQIPNADSLEARVPAPTAVPSYLVDGLFPFTRVLHGPEVLATPIVFIPSPLGQPMLLTNSELSGRSPNITDFVQYLMSITGGQGDGSIVTGALDRFGIGNCPLVSSHIDVHVWCVTCAVATIINAPIYY